MGRSESCIMSHTHKSSAAAFTDAIGSENRFPKLASILPDIRRSLTAPLQHQFAKLSPFIRRKCGLQEDSKQGCDNRDYPVAVADISSEKDTEDATPGDNSEEIETLAPPVVANVVPCCNLVIQDGDNYVSVPVCQVEEDFTALERSLPWRRVVADNEQPTLSQSPPNAYTLEDVPQLARDPVSSLPPRCWGGNGHHHRHYSNNSATPHHSGQMQHFLNQGPSLVTECSGYLPTPVSDSAHGSSVESALGDHHLTATCTTASTQGSTESNQQQQHMLTDLCNTAPPWSRSNSHDLPTVLEEDLDDMRRLSPGQAVDTSLCSGRKYSSPNHHSERVHSTRKHSADMSMLVVDRSSCSEIAIVCSNVQDDSQSKHSSDDYLDGRKSQCTRWCLSDQCSAPLQSPMCRDAGFFDDQSNNDVPKRVSPHWRGGLHPRDAETKVQSLLHSSIGGLQVASTTRRRRWSLSQMPSSAAGRRCCQGHETESYGGSMPDEIMLANVLPVNEDRVLLWLQASREHMPIEGEESAFD